MFEAVLKGWWAKGNLDTVDEDGWTLLHLAASWGHKNMVEKLLNEGVNPNARTNPPDPKHAGQIAMEYLDNSETARDILIEIVLAQSIEEPDEDPETSTGGSKQSGVEPNQTRCWRWLSHDRSLTTLEKEQRKVESSKVKELIKESESRDRPPTQDETLWYHLPVNSVSVPFASFWFAL